MAVQEPETGINPEELEVENAASQTEPVINTTEPEPEQPQPVAGATHKGLSQNTLERFKSTKQLLQNSGKEQGAADKVASAKQQINDTAKKEERQLEKREAGVILKAGAEAAVQGIRAVVIAIGPEVLLVIIIIIAIIGLFFAFRGAFSIIGDTGGGLAQYPNSQTQKDQAVLLAGIGGDLSSQKTVTQKAIDATRARFNRIQAEAQTNAGSQSLADVTKRINAVQAIITQIEQLKNANNMSGAIKLMPSLATAELAAEKGLPWGAWIAADALKYANAGAPSSQFTSVTGADDSVACASVVSSILNEVGVPQVPVSSTLDIWDNPVLSQIVAPLDGHQLSKSTYANNASKLQPGDIIWYGNGYSGGSQIYPDALFNHVAIYVGGGQEVDNSSSKATVVKRAADRSDIIFNGAKRYAP